MPSKTPKILMGCPVRNREWILPQYLQHLYDLDYPKEFITPCFILNDSTDASGEILEEFARQHQGEYNSIIITRFDFGAPEDTRNGDIRKEYIFHSLANVRNQFLWRSMEVDVDYIFSVDSDILCPPDTLNRLLEDDKDIVAAHIWNNAAKTIPNFLNRIPGDERFTHYRDFPRSSLFQCDVTGAVYLIKSDIVRAGAHYEYHPQGEDIAFCMSAKSLGFEVWGDSRIHCQHIMWRS